MWAYKGKMYSDNEGFRKGKNGRFLINDDRCNGERKIDALCSKIKRNMEFRKCRIADFDDRIDEMSVAVDALGSLSPSSCSVSFTKLANHDCVRCTDADCGGSHNQRHSLEFSDDSEDNYSQISHNSLERIDNNRRDISRSPLITSYVLKQESECRHDARLKNLKLHPVKSLYSNYRKSTPDNKEIKVSSCSKYSDDEQLNAYDYELLLKRSRNREKQRIRTQHLTIQKYCKTNESQVFWDGFQWVNKGEGNPGYDQQMNATRRARRLHIGNVPISMNVTESEFKQYLWQVMKEKNLCLDPNVCPILHIWFARDRGGNFGFIEMSTVEEAHNVLRLDGFIWHGVPIRINRPTDWKKAVTSHAIDILASTSNLAVAESLVAAVQQATTTGNSAGLISLVSRLPEGQQKDIINMMKQHMLLTANCADSISALPVDFVKERIKADLLIGPPSRIVRIIKPSSELDDDEYEDVLSDIKEECAKYGSILSSVIITPSIKQRLNSIIADIGDVFFEFAITQQADNCILNMSGRIYDHKIVKMIRYDENVFSQKLKPYAENLFLKVLKTLNETR